MPTSYRIGISTIEILQDGKPRGIGEVSMCREDAPIDWHSKVLYTFMASSWSRACGILETYNSQVRMSDITGTKGLYD